MTRILNVTLMMLILAFFIVLNTIAVPNENKRKIALGSLIGSLGALPGGLSHFQSKDHVVVPNEGGITRDKARLYNIIGQFENYLAKSEESMFTRLGIEQNSITLLFENRLIFKEGYAKFNDNGIAILRRLIPFFTVAAGTLLIESHTDKNSVAKEYDDNLSLSIARAGKIARWIGKHRESKQNNLAIAGYGDLIKLKPIKLLNDKISDNRTSIRYLVND